MRLARGQKQTRENEPQSDRMQDVTRQTTPAQRTYSSVLNGTPLTKGHTLSQLGSERLATLHHPPSSPRTVSYLTTLSSQRETHHTQVQALYCLS